MQEARFKPVDLFPLVLSLFGLIVAFHLGNAVLGKSLLRAQHLGTALEYAHGPINLLRPIIVGANANGSPTALELPLWQAAAGLAFKVVHSTWYGWANLVSLILFATCLWPFFQIARQYAGERAAWWATAFFLAEPLIVFVAGEAADDGLCLVLSLWFLFFAERLVRTGQGRWWFPAALFAVLSAVTKLPFFMAAGLCGVAMLLANRVRAWRPWLMLASIGALAALALIVWTRYTDKLAAHAEFPYYDFRISHNPNVAFWFFGDLQYRLNPSVWLKGGWRFLHATLGALPLAGLLLLALFRRGDALPKLWLLAAFVPILVFTPIILQQWHYFLMCSPAVALLCGSVLARWEVYWSRELPQAWLWPVVAGIVLVGSSIDGLLAMKIGLYYDYFPQHVAAILQKYTSPKDKLIVYGVQGSGGEVLFRSGRQGLMVYSLKTLPGVTSAEGLHELLGKPDNLRRLKALGFDKLVLLSESPVWFAVEAENPGSEAQRILYPQSISASVDAWPTVYRSEDVLIKSIP